MAYRWHPKNAEVDPDNPRAWGTCDRCGFVFQLHRLQFQYAYQGSSIPISTNFLVCDTGCLDPLNPQDLPYILPPDPMPVFNARPEPYALDETSWLSTQDGDVLETQDNEPIITNIENPASDANTAVLQASLSYPGGSLGTLYLDLFNGDPSAGGVSVLSAITGSATRTNIGALLATTGQNVAVNPDFITVSAGSASVTNVNYIGFYSASGSGALLVSGPVSVSGQTIGVDTVVQFNPVSLRIAL